MDSVCVERRTGPRWPRIGLFQMTREIPLIHLNFVKINKSNRFDCDGTTGLLDSVPLGFGLRLVIFSQFRVIVCEIAVK